DLLGQSAFALLHPEDLPRARAAFEEAVSRPDTTVRVEFRFRHRDGSWRHLETFGRSHLEDPAIAGVVINSRDVSDRRRLEDQLRQAQKMEAIGQLAGGVAHDFNNILTVIQGHASLLRMSAPLSDDAGRSAQEIAQAAERASALTRQLLTFSRRHMMQPRNLDLNEVVGNMAKMLGRVLGEDISLQLSYSSQPAVIQADAGMIEQVLLNLAVNARDAMPKGGSLQVAIEPERVKPEDVGRDPEARAGHFICLTVADSGCGIAPEILSRIFEPFFTTKAVGKGTGLGLATVYGIVKQHQGWIEVQSRVGQGSTFRVYLPSTAQSPDPIEQPAKNLIRGGHETILVVEDEAPVRELVCKFLARYGYKTVQAESGAKALEVWRAAKDKIDLLLTDLVMPDRINGRELAEKLWNDRPSLKVIFTSGYSADVVGKDFVLRRGLNYLQKPYHPHKLATTVRECLDAVN
ncbi:MAG TPA: ATP-binding protein, partial [Verrucomicrobiae bacterium]|nr:ATP-binding protein [Verrucomicrobiae bacterium]